MSAFSDLMGFQRQTEALGQVMGRLHWDQETIMPPASAEQRADEIAALETVLHARRTDPRLGEWLASAAPADAVEEAQLREIRRSFVRSVKVPEALAAEIARVTSLAQGVWARARASDDFAAFAPVLAHVVDLKRQEAAAIADGRSLYDALLDDHEPGATAAGLSTMFGALRPRLVALRDAILGTSVRPPVPSGPFDQPGQVALSRELAGCFGYDFARGRIDMSAHPFSSGSGNDVRITTRTVPHDPFNCLYSTIHETGHATYEQAVDQAFLLSAIGRGASMGVHESQSRIYENQLGRSRAFCAYLFRRMTSIFGAFGIADAETFYAAVNRVSPGFIRTEADEVHYNLHVLMRFDLERSLIDGSLAPADLEEAWNARFLADFGVAVDRPSNGCLQDVHWSVGLFGYFPTYTLGNVYAGCLYERLRADLPMLDAELERGDASLAVAWLAERLQRYGSLRPPRETIVHAFGQAPSEEPLLRYLETKFRAIYKL